MENIDEKLKEILNRVRMKHFLSLRTLIYQGVAISTNHVGQASRLSIPSLRGVKRRGNLYYPNQQPKTFLPKKKDFINLLSNIKI